MAAALNEILSMEVRETPPATYAFGPYSLSPSERVLRYRGEPLVLAPKTLDLLVELLAGANRVVPKHDLIEALWPDTFVDEANLAQNVYVLRQLFKRHGSDVSIENIPKRGYRLTVPPPETPVRAVAPQGTPAKSRAYAAFALSLVVIAAIAGLNRWQPAEPPALKGNSLANYLLARSLKSEGSPRNLRRGAALFSAVVRESPESAEGYAGLAESDASLAYYAASEPERARLQADALSLAREAVTKNPHSSDAYAALGGVEFSISYRDEPARHDFERALALNPNQPDALAWYGSLLLNEGRVERARGMFARALGVDPNSPGTIAALAWSDYEARDYAGAILLSRQLLAGGKLSANARITFADACIAAHDFANARAAVRVLERDRNTRVQGLALAAQLAALTGDRATGRNALRAIDASASGVHSWDAASIAAAYLSVHDRAHALAWLERVDFFERPLLARDPRFAALAGDSVFRSWSNG